MGGTAGKTMLVLALIAAMAALAAGCGGGDDDSTATATTAPTTTTEGQQGGGQQQSGQAGKPAQKQGGGESAGKQGAEQGGSSAGAGSGGSSAGEGSASFRTKGGDNSIQDFGDEADGGEREAAGAALATYLAARAAGSWAKSCEYLAAAAVKPLEQLAESSPQLKSKGCAAIIGALSAQLPASTRRSPLVGGVASLRFEGDRGFALFHGPKGVDYFVPMVKEDGQWKVGALAPSEFP